MLALGCLHAEEHTESVSRAGGEEATAPALGPLVIVADDDADFRATLVTVLRRYGMRVREVEDGNALVKVLGGATAGDEAPDLVITDNHMPGCSGLTALAIMQQSGMRTPVIVMTGFRDMVTEERAHRYGALAVLRKPFAIAELTALIAMALPM